ncbi:MAG: prolyl oligopeptidase family serine peptidase [Bacteroidales bacterium]|nr:prolyl oligopeptidase family serine peptidase [Bacteroidales bacterium]
MRRKLHSLCLLFALFTPSLLISQSTLTIERIMQGEKFTGISPESPRWSATGNNLYFNWTENVDSASSLYVLREGSRMPEKVSLQERKNLPPMFGTYNRNRTKMVYSQNGDICLLDVKTGGIRKITFTSANEGNPVFSLREDKIIYMSGNNFFSWNIADGSTIQLTDLRTGRERVEEPPYKGETEKFLYENQLLLFKTLAERKKERDKARAEARLLEPETPQVIYTGTGQARSVRLSPDENFITFQTATPTEQKRTIVPSYVTLSGYTEDIPARSKVGASMSAGGTFNIYDLVNDTLYQVKTDDIPGIKDTPEYLKDYPGRKASKPEKRVVSFRDPLWSDDGKKAVVEILSDDNKDRWIMLLEIRTGALTLLDRQHDEAWIGGPGVGYGMLGWLPDNKTIFFQSEESGYSHLYLLDVTTGQKRALTSGQFEIYSPTLSNDKKTWYFIANETDAGIRELYRMPVQGGPMTKLTSLGGGIEYDLSPDEKYFALLMSEANEPWELYIMENKSKAVPVKITESTTKDFRSYNWRIPEYVKFRASDGVMVPARLYRPKNPVMKGPAVIFVHGAGYLQNAHRWWSSYSREYMFHNFLVDNGYTVLDLDYRGSAGYGRDWRTAVYRDMGGRDLDDHADGAKYLVENCQVDPGRIGIYGGSYGGFITLMAMFRKPDVFAAGAGLRSVTDWAHYNHGYTSDILNTPAADSIAYVRSSPIYYAEGLKGALLMCHGMVDDNVHFQDIVRLVQRLIELGKENWELAVYPLESHGFVEASSWTDEYKRIFKLFEENLKGNR